MPLRAGGKSKTRGAATKSETPQCISSPSHISVDYASNLIPQKPGSDLKMPLHPENESAQHSAKHERSQNSPGTECGSRGKSRHPSASLCSPRPQGIPDIHRYCMINSCR